MNTNKSSDSKRGFCFSKSSSLEGPRHHIQNKCGCIRYTHQIAETAVSKCLSMHLDLLGLDVERSEVQEGVLRVGEGRRFLKKDRPLFQPYSKEKAKHCNEVCEPKRSQCGYVSQKQMWPLEVCQKFQI